MKTPAVTGRWALLAAAAACCATAHADPNQPPLTARGPARLLSVTASAATVGRYQRLELTVSLSASYDNPYDPDQVDLTAVFTGPSGRSVVVPGFFYQGYRREGTDPDSPLLSRDGDPCWKVRFAPTELGRWQGVVRLRNRFGGELREDAAPPVLFACAPSPSAGFIRLEPAARTAEGPRWFAFDSGAPFFPVGQNVQNDWPDYRHTRLLAEGGANCVRAWLFCHWTWLEWTPMTPPWAPPGHWIRQYGGAGVYNQGIAWTGDEYLQNCERDGVRVMMCFGAAHEVNEGEDVGRWGGHPYNRANGGFLAKPEEFWTSPRARQLFRNKLRYLAARYGWSTALWAWEFWNELGDSPPEVTDWHREMGDYLASVDGAHHLRTVSTWQPEPQRLADLWRLPQIDFTQSHNYAPSVAFEPTIRAYRQLYGKPHVVGEGGGLAASPGGDAAGQRCTVDPEGIDFHNSLWLPVMAGSAGGTLAWHWRERLEPLGLAPQYGALTRFLALAPPGRLRQALVELQVARPAQPAGLLSPAVVVPLGSAWGSRAPADRFFLRPDGALDHPELLTRGLFGKWREVWRRPPTFVVTYPTGGRFLVHVGEVSHGVLTVSVDGREVLREGTEAVPRHTVDRDFAVEVPAGTHEIRVDNAGGDWIEAQHFVFTAVRDPVRFSDLETYALRTDAGALVWLRNRLNEWAFRAAGVPLRPTPAAVVLVRGLPPGEYTLEWWDTYRGVVTGRETARADAAGLRLAVPAVERDLACVVRRGPSHTT